MTSLLRRCTTVVLAAACACLLSACLEGYDEEMVINSDLSGSAVVKVKLPDALTSKFDGVREEFAPEKVKSRFGALRGVKLKYYNLSEGRYPEATFEFTFDSVEKLSAAAVANEPVQMLIGEFKVTRQDGKTVLERQLGNGKTEMPLPDDKFATYKLHFTAPFEIAGTDSGFKDSSHDDVRYRWSLADIAGTKPVMVNKLLAPFPVRNVLIAVFVALVIAWMSWLKFSKKKFTSPVPAKTPGQKPSPQSPDAQQPPQPPQRPGPPRRPGPPQR